MLTAAANAVFRPAAPTPASRRVALVHAAPWNPLRLILASAIGVIAATGLARAFPAFCTNHALALSLAACLALAVLFLRRIELSSRRLLCDGRWLGYCSSLLGMVADLDELAAVEAHERGGSVNGIILRARNRELLRLDPRQWHGAELQSLLSALLQSRPQVQLDAAARQWLRRDSSQPR